MSCGERSSSARAGTQMRPSLRRDSLISVNLDWVSSDWGMHVGWIWVKHGLANAGPLRCARQIAVALDAFALVERKRALEYPPVASTTAWAACEETSPVRRSRTTT